MRDCVAVKMASPTLLEMRMPRKPRLDLAGVAQHVVQRGHVPKNGVRFIFYTPVKHKGPQ